MKNIIISEEQYKSLMEWDDWEAGDHPYQDRWPSNVRIHNSNVDNMKFHNMSPSAFKIGPKPNGLWYGFGGSWIERAHDLMRMRKHFYIIEVTDRVLKINNTDDVLKFHEEYKAQWGERGPEAYIDWPRCYNDYAGIEVQNPIGLYKQLDKYHEWLYHWDVTSGVIWHESGIKNIKQVE